MHLRYRALIVCTLLLAVTNWLPAQSSSLAPRIQQFRDALAQLDLSPEQKLQIATLFTRIEKQAADIAELARDDQVSARELMRDLAADMRAEIARILTPQQQQALREKMQRRPEDTPPPPPPPPAAPPPQRPGADRPNSPAMGDANRSSSDQPSQPAQRGGTAAPFNRAGTPLPVGQAAPPINLVDLDGKKITLDTLPNRPVVLIFGSYSCPAFRDQVRLLNDLAEAHRRRAHFLIVYTREAHALGQWEVQRNEDDGIAIEQHRSLDDRKTQATIARRTLDIRIPIALDDMEDSTVRAYNAFPNGAVILSPDRKIALALRWADPFVINEHLLKPAR